MRLVWSESLTHRIPRVLFLVVVMFLLPLVCSMRGHIRWKAVVREIILRRKKVEKNWKVSVAEEL